ncbi:MAG: helix-turn-helix domain-containing protein [Bacteroidetes bacterium]|nr:MAG: helix-turn-helix domain-containing protein [Bacteroidota bacterium]
MKPKLLDRSSTQSKPFAVRENTVPNFLKIWHYHPELELVVIKASEGTRFVGDSIEKFEPGEVILIGKNLPHMWLNYDSYFQKNSGLIASAYSIHFREDFVGKAFLNLNSTSHLSNLFEKARRGIRFLDLNFSIQTAIRQLIEEKDDFQKLMQLLRILHQLAKHEKITLLSSEGYLNTKISEGSDEIHEYIFKNFKNSIQLNDVASIAGMNPSAFSRYFKRIHQKTFSRYLIEIRIGYACKLLIENKSNISAVCYESGFNNLSNFNKQFRKIKGLNPSEFIRLHQ